MGTIKNFPNNEDVYIGAEYVMPWLHGRTSGVFGANGALAVTANDDGTLSVSDGYGWMANSEGNGCVFWNDTEKTTGSKMVLDPGLADPTLPKIIRVVVTWETINYARRPDIEILQGTPASDPQPPALTNSTLKRQISLAQVYIGASATEITPENITDERLNPEVCGIVTDAVSVDTSVMEAQFRAYLAIVQGLLEDLNAGTAVMLRSIYDTENKAQDVFKYPSHVYKATFLADGWTGDGPYTQTVAVEKYNNGPDITSKSVMLPGMGIDDAIQGDAQDALLEAAGIVDKGTKTFGANTITCVAQEKPESDAEVFFSAMKGGV